MNGRTILWGTLMVVGLGAGLARADGLIHPVAYDDRMGPVYYPASGTVFYGSVNQPVFNVGNAAPAPAYEPPAYSQPTYTSPAYTQPSYVPPAYAAQPPVQHPAVCCLHRPAVTTYVPTYTSYRPTLVTTYRAPVYQAAAPVAAVATGPRVIVRPKVYVEGQPLRNLLKAITP